MNQDFSNYLLGNPQFLAVSEVQSHHPSMHGDSEFNYQSNNEIDSQFHDLYNYSTNVLKTWGITIGVMAPSRENMKTVNGFMELIRIRQRDLDYKEKIKEDVAKSEYQKDMMKNKIKLAQDEMNQYKRKLGQVENRAKEEEVRFRKEMKAMNTERQELVQIRQKLEQKNTQVCHEMKKKESEMNRVKDSMKKGAEKVGAKNSFDLVSAVMQGEGEETSKFTLLKEKYENQRKHYLRENSIMKEQLSDAEDIINDFISFMKENCQVKALQELNLNPNHPMEYNQGRLLERLAETLQNIKTNIIQFVEQPIKPKQAPQPQPQYPSKQVKRANTFQPAPKLSQSVSVKPSTQPPPQDYFKKIMKEDISIISYIDVKDIDMPMRGKEDYDKWDILYNDKF